MMHAIKYVETCLYTLEIFAQDPADKSESAQLLSINGPFLNLRLIKESTYYKPVYTFASDEQFCKLATEIQSKNLGKLLYIPELSQNQNSTAVFYKCPPDQLSTTDIELVDVSVSDYTSSYEGHHIMSRRSEKLLKEAISIMSHNNPYIKQQTIEGT